MRTPQRQRKLYGNAFGRDTFATNGLLKSRKNLRRAANRYRATMDPTRLRLCPLALKGIALPGAIWASRREPKRELVQNRCLTISPDVRFGS
jgi:hypothetical protein